MELFTTLSATARKRSRDFLALRVGVGVGEATLGAPGVSLLADYFPRSQIGRAMSIYSLGVFFGSGLGYFIGAWVVGLVDVAGTWHLPVLGEIRPWQSAFVAVGLPGFLIAALFLTVREPGSASGMGAGRAMSDLWRYVAKNRRTYITHSVGFGVFAMVNYAIAAWIPTLFARTYGWPESRTGRAIGILTMTVGVLGVVAGGWVTDRIGRRGRVERPGSVGIGRRARHAGVGDALSARANAGVALVGAHDRELLRRLPVGRGSAAAAEMAPSPVSAPRALRCTSSSSASSRARSVPRPSHSLRITCSGAKACATRSRR